MTLTDLLTESEWNDFIKDLHEEFGISCAAADADGAHVSHYDNCCNRICPVIKDKPEVLTTICASAMKSFTAETKASGKPLIEACDIGLIKVAVPVFVGETFLGTVGGCGLLPEQGEVEEFLIQQTTGLPEERIAELADGIATMTEVQARKLADTIAARLAAIVSSYEARRASEFSSAS